MLHLFQGRYTLPNFRAVLRRAKAKQTYDALVEQYGVNRYYLWHIINSPGYLPPNHILQQLHIPAPSQVFSVDGPIPDGAQAAGALQCACGQSFVSNHPRRKRCFSCSPCRGRRAPDPHL